MPGPAVIVPWLYAVVPIAIAAHAGVRASRGRKFLSLPHFVLALIAGAAGGLMLVIAYSRAAGHRVPLTQVALASYVGMAVASALWLFNQALVRVIGLMTGGISSAGPCCAAADIIGKVARAGLLLAVGVPFVAAAVLVYRPRMTNPQTPRSELGASFDNIDFPSTDGIALGGWWIPAAGESGAESNQTVILCHGFAADKTSQIQLIGDVAAGGYNVLAFDFRAHGQSGGQITTFGSLERNDVLGAVRWVRKTHPGASRRILGVGTSLGAAALIGAAADPGDGQYINAIAVISPYDRLTTLIQDTADAHFAPNGGRLITRFVLPLVEAQLGAHLSQFDLARDVDKLAPRPLLVIADEAADRAAYWRSRHLYDRASQPKYGYWLGPGGKTTLPGAKDNTPLAVQIFFKTAREIL